VTEASTKLVLVTVFAVIAGQFLLKAVSGAMQHVALSLGAMQP
jgi:hypothetical protein